MGVRKAGDLKITPLCLMKYLVLQPGNNDNLEKIWYINPVMIINKQGFK